MTPLMREALKQELDAQPPKPDHTHAGLWLQRGWPAFVTGDSKDNKTGHINRLCAIQPSALYKKVFTRWEETAKTLPGAALFATVSQRLLIGSNAASALETGAAIQHSYGMPMIPGSAVKGCARAYAQQLGLGAEYLAMLFGLDEGELAGPGGLVWHDAWWRPGGQEKYPFVADVVTVHHPEYYQGKEVMASDTDTPVPNAQLATHGEFFFYIGCEHSDSQPWAELAIQLLKATLHGTGIGGKRAAGYGRMAAKQQDSDIFNQQAQIIRDQAAQPPLPANQQTIQDFVAKFVKAPNANNTGTDLFVELCSLLHQAGTNPDWSQADREQLAKHFPLSTIKQKFNGLGKNQERIKQLLKQLNPLP